MGEEKKERKSRRIGKLTLGVFEKAAKGTYGNISVIAKNLGVPRSTVYRFIEKYPEAKEIVEREREELVDKAESQLVQAIERGERWAVKFVLKTLGSKRGYVQKFEADVPAVPAIIIQEHQEDNEIE